MQCCRPSFYWDRLISQMIPWLLGEFLSCLVEVWVFFCYTSFSLFSCLLAGSGNNFGDNILAIIMFLLHVLQKRLREPVLNLQKVSFSVHALEALFLSHPRKQRVEMFWKVDFWCRICGIDQYIKIPPSTVCQNLVCHLVTDFAIRSLCCSCI